MSNTPALWNGCDRSAYTRARVDRRRGRVPIGAI